jgi:hypothetical protein
MSATRQEEDETTTTPWDLINQDYREWLTNTGVSKVAFNTAELTVLGILKSQYERSSFLQQEETKHKRQKSTAYRVDVVIKGARHFAGARGNVFRMLEKYGAVYTPSDGGIHRQVMYVEDNLHVQPLFLSWEQACGFQNAVNEWEIYKERFANLSGVVIDPKTPMEVERPPNASEPSLLELINGVELENSTHRGPARQASIGGQRRTPDRITRDSAREEVVLNDTAVGTGRGLLQLQGPIQGHRRETKQHGKKLVKRCRLCRESPDVRRQMFAVRCSGRGGFKFCNWKELDTAEDRPGWL